MVMKIGDFFKSSKYAHPVNPRQIKITAVAKGAILPSGDPNPHNQVRADLEGVLVFLGGQTLQECRAAATRSLKERFTDAKTGETYFGDNDWYAELNYQVLYRAIREWDSAERKVGDRLFESLEQLRELVEIVEATRLIRTYNEYVAEEHPADEDVSGKVEGVDHGTFRGTKG